MNCVWNDQLVTIKGSKLFLQMLIQLQDDHQWSLSPVAGGSITVKDCLYMNVVLDYTLGLSCLFLLTCQPSSGKYELLECNFTENCLVTRSKCIFNCDEQTVVYVQLLDGPFVLLASALGLTLVNGYTGQQHIIAVTELVKEVCTIKTLWAFSLRKDASILLLLKLYKEQGAHWTCLRLQEKDGWVLEESEKCVPYEYGCIATCVESTESLTMTSGGQFVIRRQFYVGTSYRQVVVFEAGVLLYCVALNAVPHSIVVLEVMYTYFALYNITHYSLDPVRNCQNMKLL